MNFSPLLLRIVLLELLLMRLIFDLSVNFQRIFSRTFVSRGPYFLEGRGICSGESPLLDGTVWILNIGSGLSMCLHIFSEKFFNLLNPLLLVRLQ